MTDARQLPKQSLAMAAIGRIVWTAVPFTRSNLRRAHDNAVFVAAAGADRRNEGDANINECRLSGDSRGAPNDRFWVRSDLRALGQFQRVLYINA